jgi:NAD(P)-dependent dehydrogenase (short-subunit alcohol dehydrogenase family)
MTAALLDHQPELGQRWASMNPLGRLGRPEELRGVIAWLASDVRPFVNSSNGASQFHTTLCLGEHLLHRKRVSDLYVPLKFSPTDRAHF